MKRRDFVKAGICLGCAGALGAGISIRDDLQKKYLSENHFLYKNVFELPTKVKIDICNLCQLNCAACWIRKDEELIKTIGGGFGYVNFETFKNFVDRHPFIREIELSHSGEIFLNPDLDKIMEYAFKKQISLSAYNGVNLNTVSEKTMENLVKYKMRRMDVSIDAATPETYPIYRRGGDFNTVINNIKTINKYKEKYNSPYPILKYKFVVFGHNEHEIDAAKILAKKLNMPIKFELNIVEGYSPLKDKELVLKKINQNNFMSNNNKKYFEKPIENCMGNFIEKYKTNKNTWFACKDLWESPQIDWNGNLFGCCCQAIETLKVNVFEEGLLKALNNERMLYAKLMLTDLSVPPKEDIPCSHCFVYNKLKWDNIPLELT